MAKQELKQLFLDTLEFKVSELSNNPRIANILSEDYITDHIELPEGVSASTFLLTWQYLNITGITSLGVNDGEPVLVEDILENGTEGMIKTLINKMPDGSALGAFEYHDADGDGDIDADDKIIETMNKYVKKYGKDTIVVSAVSDITDIEDTTTASVVISSEDVMNTLTTNTYYNNLSLVSGEVHEDIKLNAINNLSIDGLNISGVKGSSNGKLTYSAREVDIKNVTVEDGSTIYNVFEGSQATNDTNYHGVEKLTVSDVEIGNPSLTHNIVNVYTPAENAVITIKNSTFNLDVNNSNVLRLANYLNSSNVTVNFENVNWTYENAATDSSDWKWAGLVIYQPASKDNALTGDTSKLATWKFNFKNCKYNGEKVNRVNYGEHNQVMYGYNINKSNTTSDLSEIVTITFK